jgi:hypothetical protein
VRAAEVSLEIHVDNNKPFYAEYEIVKSKPAYGE